MLRSSSIASSPSLFTSSDGVPQVALTAHTSMPAPRKPSSHWKKGSDKNKNSYLQKLIDNDNSKKTGKHSVHLNAKMVDTSAAYTYQSISINALPTTLLNEFVSVSTDASGQYVALLAQYSNQMVYLSNNYGESYDLSLSLPYNFELYNGLGAIAIASDAPNYIAFTSNDGIFVSNNTGASFTQVPSTASLYNWIGLAMSSTGQYMYATYGGGFYSDQGYLVASTNYGQTFNALSNATMDGYVGLCTSGNGQYFFAAADYTVYGSKDYGNSISIIFNLDSINAIGCSNTGQYVGITNQMGYIYISSDYGKTWITSFDPTLYPTLYPPDWGGISFSSSGQYVFAVAVFDPIYISSNFGQSFQEVFSSSSEAYSFGAISSSGQYMYAVSGQGYPYSSNNYGVSWTPLYYDWGGVASSQNGQYRFACLDDTQPALYMSSNSGNAWSIVTSVGATDYFHPSMVACNSNCQYIAVIAFLNEILLSSNNGNSWNTISFGNPNFTTFENIYVGTAIAISSTGQYMTIVTGGGPIFISSNYGSSFEQATVSLSVAYSDIAMSSTGEIQIASSSVDENDSQSKFFCFVILVQMCVILCTG